MQNEPLISSAETLHVRTDLTFGDGFRFGCGFMAAIVIFWIVLGILSSLLAMLALILAPQLVNLVLPR